MSARLGSAGLFAKSAFEGDSRSGPTRPQSSSAKRAGWLGTSYHQG